MFYVNRVKQRGTSPWRTRLLINVAPKWHFLAMRTFMFYFESVSFRNSPSLSNVISNDEMALYNNPCYNHGSLEIKLLRKQMRCVTVFMA